MKGLVKTESQMVEVLERMVDYAGSQKAVAEWLGVSAQYLSDVMSGRRYVSKEMGKKLGYKKTISFVGTGSGAIGQFVEDKKRVFNDPEQDKETGNEKD